MLGVVYNSSILPVVLKFSSLVEKPPEDYGRNFNVLYANQIIKKFKFPGAEDQPILADEVCKYKRFLH